METAPSGRFLFLDGRFEQNEGMIDFIRREVEIPTFSQKAREGRGSLANL